MKRWLDDGFEESGRLDFGFGVQGPNDGKCESLFAATERAEIGREQNWHHVDSVVGQVDRSAT